MGAVGRWIDETCRREPEVMRHVLNRSFGPLNYFIGPGGDCGCLVGSYGLVRGDSWVNNIESHNGPPRGTKARAAGLRVGQLCYLKGNNKAVRKRSDEFVVRLLKQRIRRALGLAPVIHHEEEVITCRS